MMSDKTPLKECAISPIFLWFCEPLSRTPACTVSDESENMQSFAHRLGGAVIKDLQEKETLGHRTAKTTASVASGWAGGFAGAAAGNSVGTLVGEITHQAST